MKPICDRCGRPIVAAGAAAGARTEATCSCDRVPAALAAAGAPEGPGRDAGPLPGPREGNLEVDPWSLPVPEGGYESLELDDAPPATAASTPAAPAEAPQAPDDAAPDIASSIAARADAEAAEPPVRSRNAILVGAGVAVAVVAAIAIALVVRGRSPGTAGARGVRVTVTQEVRWDQAPPLAPIDPSFVERARPAAPAPVRPAAPAPVRPAAASTRPSAPARSARGAPAARTTSAAAAAAAPAPAETEEPAPQPSPAAAAPEPQPAQPPPAPVTAADIPLPPPPVIATRPQPPAPAATAARARPPVLETKACVADALRVPRGLEGSLPGEVVMHVDVGDDGRPANVSFPGPVDPRLRTALLSAVRTCRFTPGADASGRPAAASTTMRLRFE